MLHARIRLLKSYLASLSPSDLTSPDQPSSACTSLQNQQPSPPSKQEAEPSHSALRALQSLMQRLPLLEPPDRASFEQEILSEKADVTLVSLLGALGKSVKDARETGRKFAVVEQGKHLAAKRGMGMGVMREFGNLGMGMIDDGGGRGMERDFGDGSPVVGMGVRERLGSF